MLLFLKIVAYVLLLLLVVLTAGFLYTRWQSARIAHRYPNVGQLTDIDGFRLDGVHWPRPETADLPPPGRTVVRHGAQPA